MDVIGQAADISIHAPRTGSDEALEEAVALSAYFNPRSPHGERRISSLLGGDMSRFQSTLPARGATPVGRYTMRFVDDFNPRSPHGERLGVTLLPAPLVPFQSTLPARGATDPAGVKYWLSPSISIHAPRTGSDSPVFRTRIEAAIISIHAPRTGSDCAK